MNRVNVTIRLSHDEQKIIDTAMRAFFVNQWHKVELCKEFELSEAIIAKLNADKFLAERLINRLAGLRQEQFDEATKQRERGGL